MSENTLEQQDVTVQPHQGFFDPELVGPLALLAVIFIAMLFMERGSKGKLTDNDWASSKHLKKCRNKGQKQIKQGIKNKVSLYLGTKKKICLPSSEMGIVAVGAPGSGKTRSAIDPGIRAAIEQGITSFVYDVKGELLKRHAAYAASHGFDVHVFAPGFDYSGTLNFLDFMKDSTDSTMAREMAKVMIKNSQRSTARDDPFFGPLGEMLVETLFEISKESPFPDILMAWSLLSLSDLEQRFKAAQEMNALGVWTEISATGILSVANADKTVAGIKGQAVNIFSGFINRDFIPAIAGDSSIPLDVDGKQIIFFQIDEQREKVTAPLVATAIHMLIKRNLNNIKHSTRKNPLCFFYDEAPSLYLPDFVNWLNRFREYGGVNFLSYQNDAQMKECYGPNITQAIAGGCATKIIFNPNHAETAQSWSRFLGDKEIQLRNKSVQRGRNSSRSFSEQRQKIPLFSPEKFNRLKPGECIIITPGMDYVPHHCKQVKIPKADLKLQENSERLWGTKVEPRLVERYAKSKIATEHLSRELDDRAVIADCVLSMPREVKAKKTKEVATNVRTT